MADATVEQEMLYIVSHGSIEIFDRVAQRRQLAVERFASSDAFIDHIKTHELLRPGCVVTELFSNAVDGARIQTQLIEMNCTIPTIFVGKEPNLDSAVQALTRGGITVLLEPLDAEQVDEAVEWALAADCWQRRADHMYTKRVAVLASLSDRQREVLDLVALGLPTKAISSRLRVSKRLVELERSALLRAFRVSDTSGLTLAIGEHRVIEQFRYFVNARQQLRGPASRRQHDCSDKEGS